MPGHPGHIIIIEKNSEIQIDLSGVTSVEQLHDILKRELNFPDFYGRNWDAAWDAIIAIVEMPRTLTFYHWASFQKRFERDARILRKISEDYNRLMPEKRINIKSDAPG